MRSYAGTKNTGTMYPELLIRAASRVILNVVSVVKDSMETMNYMLTAAIATKDATSAIVNLHLANTNTTLTTMHWKVILK